MLVPALFLAAAACSGARPSEREIAEAAAVQYVILRQAAGASANSCVQAGVVAEAYRRAGDAEAYREWKVTEARDCEEAGYQKHVH